MKLRLFFLIALLTLLLTGCAADNAALLTLQGRNQVGLDHPEQAVLWYDQAIAVDPNFAEAYYFRAGTYASLEAYDQAIADLDRTIALRPEWADAYAARGATYFVAGNTKLAYEDFAKVFALHRYFPAKMEQRMAMCYFQLVEEDLLKGPVLEVTMEQMVERTMEQIFLKTTEPLLEGSTKAIELDPGNALAYYCRADAYIGMGELEKAVADFGRAIELNPVDTLAYWYRAYTYVLIKDRTEPDRTEPDILMKIQRDVDKAIELNPDITDAFMLVLWLEPYLPAVTEDE